MDTRNMEYENNSSLSSEEILEEKASRNTFYVNKKGKHLEATENGRKVISLIPSDDLLSPILSAKWEAQLQNLENGKDEHGNIRPHNENLQVYKSFMNDVKENTKHWIKEVNPDVAKKMKIS